MSKIDWEKLFANAPSQTATAVVVSDALLEIIKNDTSITMAEIGDILRREINALKSIKDGIILSSVAELFFRHITLNSSSHNTIESCRIEMISRGNDFREEILNSRTKIAKLFYPFINDGIVILTHSYSRVVMETLISAAKAKKVFSVIVTESIPDKSGYKTKEILDKAGIPCRVILDPEVGQVIENVNMVVVGADSVCQSGGIINKIGTFPMSMCAKEYNKPFYVLAEKFKFAMIFPLNHKDLYRILREEYVTESPKTKDYTYPRFITLLFTDLGVLTTAAVCDELLNIYT